MGQQGGKLERRDIETERRLSTSRDSVHIESHATYWSGLTQRWGTLTLTDRALVFRSHHRLLNLTPLEPPDVEIPLIEIKSVKPQRGWWWHAFRIWDGSRDHVFRVRRTLLLWQTREVRNEWIGEINRLRAAISASASNDDDS